MDRGDLEGELMASFKLAARETRARDEVEALANAWRTLAGLYGRALDNLDPSQRTERVVEHLEKIRDWACELYRLNA